MFKYTSSKEDIDNGESVWVVRTTRKPKVEGEEVAEELATLSPSLELQDRRSHLGNLQRTLKSLRNI